MGDMSALDVRNLRAPHARDLRAPHVHNLTAPHGESDSFSSEKIEGSSHEEPEKK